MISKQTLSMTLIASLAGTAAAGTVDVQSLVDSTAQFVQNYANVYNGGDTSGVVFNGHMGVPGSDTVGASTQSFTFDSAVAGNSAVAGFNGGFTVDIDQNDAGTFFYGNVSNLLNIDFNAGNDARPNYDSLSVAFGNERWTSNDVTMAFDPGVTAFGFNYEDIGDVGGTLTVLFSTGDTQVITTSSGVLRDGFMSIVADAGEFITSINFTQTPASANDGFIFYGFSTVQVVPLPTAAFAGLGLLAGMGVVRRIRRG